MERFDDDKISNILNVIIIILLLVIMGIIIKFKFFDKTCECDNDNVSLEVNSEVNNDLNEEDKEEVAIKTLMVDIKGAVKNPGVYNVNQDSIVNDVIKLAGGLKSNASTKYINLSKKVSDEMVLVIYTNYELSKMNNTSNNQVCEVSNEDIKKCEGSSVIVSNSNSDSVKEESDINKKISINNGTKEELMNLSGIGEAKALAIIEYRNKNSGFKSLEELMNVSGIGELAYNKIKDNITL